jgi:hypothetical protein
MEEIHLKNGIKIKIMINKTTHFNIQTTINNYNINIHYNYSTIPSEVMVDINQYSDGCNININRTYKSDLSFLPISNLAANILSQSIDNKITDIISEIFTNYNNPIIEDIYNV